MQRLGDCRHLFPNLSYLPDDCEIVWKSYKETADDLRNRGRPMEIIPDHPGNDLDEYGLSEDQMGKGPAGWYSGGGYFRLMYYPGHDESTSGESNPWADPDEAKRLEQRKRKPYVLLFARNKEDLHALPHMEDYQAGEEKIFQLGSSKKKTGNGGNNQNTGRIDRIMVAECWERLPSPNEIRRVMGAFSDEVQHAYPQEGLLSREGPYTWSCGPYNYEIQPLRPGMMERAADRIHSVAERLPKRLRSVPRAIGRALPRKVKGSLSPTAKARLMRQAGIVGDNGESNGDKPLYRLILRTKDPYYKEYFSNADMDWVYRIFRLGPPPVIGTFDELKDLIEKSDHPRRVMYPETGRHANDAGPPTFSHEKNKHPGLIRAGNSWWQNLLSDGKKFLITSLQVLANDMRMASGKGFMANLGMAVGYALGRAAVVTTSAKFLALQLVYYIGVNTINYSASGRSDRTRHVQEPVRAYWAKGLMAHDHGGRLRGILDPTVASYGILLNWDQIGEHCYKLKPHPYDLDPSLFAKEYVLGGRKGRPGDRQLGCFRLNGWEFQVIEEANGLHVLYVKDRPLSYIRHVPEAQNPDHDPPHPAILDLLRGRSMARIEEKTAVCKNGETDVTVSVLPMDDVQFRRNLKMSFLGRPPQRAPLPHVNTHRFTEYRHSVGRTMLRPMKGRFTLAWERRRAENLARLLKDSLHEHADDMLDDPRASLENVNAALARCRDLRERRQRARLEDVARHRDNAPEEPEDKGRHRVRLSPEHMARAIAKCEQDGRYDPRQLLMLKEALEARLLAEEVAEFNAGQGGDAPPGPEPRIRA